MAFQSMTYARPLLSLVLAAAVFIGAQTEVRADDSVANDRHTVLVTGANRGLGLEFARQYKEAGWQVIGTARNPDDAQELAALGVRVMQLDVTSQESADKLATALNGEAIDVLINNAGIFPRVGKIDEIDFDDYNRTLAVNTVGPVRVTRALLPNLRKGKLKDHRWPEQQPRQYRGKRARQFLRLSRKQGGHEHVHQDARSGTGPRRLHLHRPDAGLGADRHGRAERASAAGRFHLRHEGGARQADAGGQRDVLVLRRQPDALVKPQNAVMIVTPVVSKSPIDVRAAIDPSRSIVRPMSLCGSSSPAEIIASISS